MSTFGDLFTGFLTRLKAGEDAELVLVDALRSAEPPDKADEVVVEDPPDEGDASDEKAKPKGRSKIYLDKLYEELKPHVELEHWNAAVARSRGHAGGKAARKSEAATEPLSFMWDDYPMTDEDVGPYGWGVKLPKTDPKANYREASNPATACGSCKFYSGECALVEGSIDKRATCDLWTDRTRVMHEVVDLCARRKGADRPDVGLFIAMSEFAEPPAWINYLPRPGVYDHPEYGEIVITVERNQRFADNFNDGVYQERIPIDLEHQTKLSGAAGWITKLRVNAEGSVDAQVEWTDRGQFFIENNRFFFFSPEWYDEWVQPDTDTTIKDVAIGGALTTRPYFKEKSLRPLVASERGLAIPFRTADPKVMNLRSLAAKEISKKEVMPMSVQLTEDQAKQFKEWEEEKAKIAAERASTAAEIASLKAANETQSTALKEMAEANKKAADESRRARFFGEVRGKSDANGDHWVGPVDKHVEMMEFIADGPGEDSDIFKGYVERERATAKLVNSSNLFRELGTSESNAPASAEGRITGEVTKLLSTNPTMTRVDAIEKVAKEQPALYEAYRKQMLQEAK